MSFLLTIAILFIAIMTGHLWLIWVAIIVGAIAFQKGK